MKGVCDPLYKTLINNMFEEHRVDKMWTALVVVNSFDYEKEDIEEIMTQQRIYTDVFEIDRIKPEQRLEYLNCFNELTNTKELPMVFLKD